MQRLTREEINDMLTQYNSNLARSMYLEAELVKLRRILAIAENEAMSTEAVCVQQYTGMPHGSGVSDPTAQIGGKYADGYQPDYITELQADVRSMEDEHARKSYAVRCVQSWLLALGPLERYIVEHQMIGGEPWEMVAAGYEKSYSVSASRSSLRRRKKSALGRIYGIVGIRDQNRA